MVAANIFEARSWGLLPFHFWTAVFFVLGAIVGSFLNVCIYRLPLGRSLLRPGSHCPQCGARIPWRHNLPILSWLWLRGRSACCGRPIRPRYVLVEALTAGLFAASWVAFGADSPALALVYSALLAGLLAAAEIDREHFIIPDEITLGGLVLGVACSFLVPALHGTASPVTALQRALVGALTGAGLIYAVVRGGKVLFGRHALELPPGTRVWFAEEALVLPDREIPYEELLYRAGDSIRLVGRQVELVDRCYREAPIEVSRERVRIGADEFAFEALPGFEAVTERIELPREVMGLGDVKFMAAIGAFLGWQAVLFCLMASALAGAVTGLTLIALRRHTRAAPIPYGPFIAGAAAVWVFAGPQILTWWLGGH
jgi:leader peptidase (prepilin peptidase)/N-methyltransferase